MSAEATSAAGPETAPPTSSDPTVAASDVRIINGHLTDTELAAIAVVVSAMSVTSRLEAEERELAQGLTGPTSAWCDPVHSHPRAHGLRSRPGPSAWQFSDR